MTSDAKITLMNALKWVLAILFGSMGGLALSATDDENARAILKTQGLKSFDELTRDKNDGSFRMVWLRGEKGTIIFDGHLMTGFLEKTVLSKSGATKEKRALSESDASILKFVCGCIEFEKIPSTDPYDGGLDGDSIYMELHFSGTHRYFSRWKLFQSHKLPAIASSEPDPFALSSKPSLRLQRKSADEEALTSLAILILQIGNSGKLLPVQ